MTTSKECLIKVSKKFDRSNYPDLTVTHVASERFFLANIAINQLETIKLSPDLDQIFAHPEEIELPSDLTLTERLVIEGWISRMTWLGSGSRVNDGLEWDHAPNSAPDRPKNS